MRSRSLFLMSFVGGVLLLRGPAHRLSPVSPAECAVERVVDGDTFYCRSGSKVRLIGIDTPERGQGDAGLRARQALSLLLPLGRKIRLETDVRPTDRYRRLLAYVWAGDTLVNEEMVRRGWAVLLTIPPNVKYAERLQRAQKEARADGAGLWAGGGFDCPPQAYRRRECVTPP